ncbi:MAG TPA: CHAT domain-containing protein, partial [Allocoleopsis sp.]
DLLNQIAPEPQGNTPTVPEDTNEGGRGASESLGLKSLAHPAHATPSHPPESALTGSTTGTTQSSPSASSDRTVNSANSVGQSARKDAKTGRRKRRRIPKLWMILAGATGAIAIALLGVWAFHNREPNPDELLPKGSISELPQNSSNSQNLDLATADTSKVTAIAIEQLTRANIAQGQQAVEVLLDRGALKQANAALAAVPKSQLDIPSIVYLKGRLAWQSLRAGSKDYDVTDARRYWETAHKGDRKSATYLTALGFAYYAEGKYEQANNAWFEALRLTQETKATSGATANAANKEELTIYAGLAMGLQKSGQQQAPTQRQRFLSESQKLRQKVLSDDPVGFQPEALSKNWLWSEKAIQDWRALLTSGK